MLRRNLFMILLAVVAQAREPRPVAAVPIPTPDGKTINLAQYRGKVLVVAVISTTCGDCIKSVDILSKVQKDLGPQGFQAIAAAGDEDAKSTAGPFIQRYRPTFPVGYLTTDQIIKLADIPKDKRPVAPIFLFIDKKGVVRFQYYGDEPFFKTADIATRSIVGGLLKE